MPLRKGAHQRSIVTKKRAIHDIPRIETPFFINYYSAFLFIFSASLTGSVANKNITLIEMNPKVANATPII